jgi:ATP-dependent DNA helicase RecQ
MEFLRRQLDDPEAAPCGRCDRCTGVAVDGAVSEASLAAARATLEKPGVELPPKKLWPAGMAQLGVPVSGKLRTPPAEGRALGRLSDVGWGTRLRALFAAEDAEVPEDVLRAVVEVLAAWKWEKRPAQVAWVPSRTRPKLVASLATRLAALGRMRLLGPLVRTRDDGAAGSGGRSNSAQRVKAVYGAFSAEGLAVDGAPLLLVDDRSDSGWTIAEAARVLAEAGAGPVLPLVLALEA